MVYRTCVESLQSFIEILMRFFVQIEPSLSLSTFSSNRFENAIIQYVGSQLPLFAFDTADTLQIWF